MSPCRPAIRTVIRIRTTATLSSSWIFVFPFLFIHTNPVVQAKFLEGHALSLFRTVCKAVTDFLDTPEGMSLSRWTHVKLGFKDTDILRHASVAQRCCQFLGTQVSDSACPGLPSLGRCDINVFELMYGLHGWLRQLQIHAAYYRWYDGFKRERKCCTVQKRSWAAIEASGASTAATVKRLLLSSTEFV